MSQIILKIAPKKVDINLKIKIITKKAMRTFRVYKLIAL